MAANTKIQYSIGLEVDTKQAKQDMNDLLKAIQNISKQAVLSYDTQSIKDGINAAKELERHLTKAFSASTGNLDLSKFNASLRQSGSSLESLANQLNGFGMSGQAAFGQLANSIVGAQLPLKQTNQMVDNLLINLKKTAQWQISSSLIHGVMGQISSAISYVKNLNNSLTDIAIVSDLSSGQLAKFAANAQKLGKSLSTSTLDITNAALIYFQQGDNVLQSMQKAAITIKAANASANSSASEMSEYLTAIWNSYKVGENDLQKYVDVMAALGAKTASSMEEIATAMQKVAATANTVGVKFDQMSSIISTVSSVTRESAESIGTAYKTILARIGDLKLGNLVEDGVEVSLGLVSKQLANIGINILDAKGNMRDMGGVIDEIGAKWQGMNQAQKAAVAQTIAGKRQYTQLMALFENWDMYQNDMTITAGSDGALEKMQNTWAEGWEAASDKVRNSLEGMYSSLINDKFMTGMLNVFAEMIGGIDSVIDGMGGLGGVITLVGGLFATKLGGRTTEIIDGIRTNLGLMTGSAKKDMIDLNQQLSLLAAKKASSSISPAEKTHYESMEKSAKARKYMVQHQDEIPLEQRQAFDEQAKKFQAASAEQERVQARQSALQGEMSRTALKREGHFMDSSLIEADPQTEQGQQAKSVADQTLEEAKRAREDLQAADQLVKEAKEAKKQVDEELQALQTSAQDHRKKEEGSLLQAMEKNDGSNAQGKLEYDANEEAKKAIAIEEQIEKKKAAAAKAQSEFDTAKQMRVAAASKAQEKASAYAAADAQAKQLAGGENTQVLKQIKKDLTNNLQDLTRLPTVQLKLDNLIDLQEAHATEKELEDAGRELYQALEEGLITATNQSVLGEKLKSNIASEITNVSADLRSIADAPEGTPDNSAQLLAKEKAAVMDLQTSMQEAGFGAIQIDVEGIDSLEALKVALEQAQAKMTEIVTSADVSAEAVREAMSDFGADEITAEIESQAGAMSELNSEALDASDDMRQAGDKMEELAVPTTTTTDAVVTLTGTLLTLAGTGAAVKGAFDTITDPDATGIEKVTAALTGLMSILMAVQAVTKVTSTLENAYITAQAKKLVGIKAENLEKAKGIVVSEIENGTRKKLTLAVMAQTIAETALNVVKTIGLALQGPVGWAILAGAAAIIAVTVAIINETNARKELNEQTAQANKEITEQVAAVNTLKEDLQSLSTILHNTSLSYEEQLSKINEVTAAYGVQATMLDVLSGNYTNLESKMRSAALGEALSIASDATDSRELAEKTAQARVDARTVYATDQYGSTAREDYLRDVNTKDTDSSWFHSSSANASLVQDSAWSAFDDATWRMYDIWGGETSRDDNLTGIISNDILSQTDASGNYAHYNAEGQAWIGLNSQLEQLGFTFDTATAQLRELEVGSGDAAGLYELLSTTSAFDGLGLDAASYTNTILEQLKSDDMDLVLNARQNEEQTALIPELLHNENFDFLNLDDEAATLEDTMALINSTMGDNASLTNLEYLTNYLSGFEEYADSAQQILALSDLSQQAISVNPQIKLAEGQTEDELAMEILNDLQAQLTDEFTIDMLLKINPTDIILDTSTGNYTITDDARKLAQAIVNTETAKEKQATLANAKSAATADVISKADYATLQDSDLFENDAELREFAAKGAAERAALWEQMNAEVVEAEIAGLKQQKAAAEESLVGLDDEINAAIGRLQETVNQDLEVEDGGFLEQFEGLSGDGLVSSITDARAVAQNALTKKQAALEEYNSWTDDTTDEEREEWREKYNVEKGEESDWANQAEDDIIDLTGEIGVYDEALSETESLLNKQAYALGIIEDSTDAIDQAEYWQEVGSKLETATTGAETYAAAIGKIGNMKTDDLAWMQVHADEGEDVLSNYQNMSSNEWDAYAYEKSMEYYDELLAMYNTDSVEYVATLQAKEQATEDYYDIIEEKSLDAANNILEIWHQQQEDIASAVELLSSVTIENPFKDWSFEQVEQLKQTLIAVGYSAEEADQKIKAIGQVDSDKESAIEAFRLSTNLALSQIGSMTNEKDALYGDGFGETQVAQLSVESVADTPDVKYDGDGVYSVTLVGDGISKVLSVSDSINVSGVTDNKDGSYSITFGVNGSSAQTLTVDDSINVTGITDGGDGLYTVDFTVPNGTEQTLTVNDDIQVTRLQDNGDGSYAVSFTAPDGTEQTLTVNDDIILTGIKSDSTGNYSIEFTANGKEQTLEVKEGINVTGISNDGNGNYSVTFTTASGQTQTLEVGESINVASISDNGNGNYSIAFTTASGKRQTLTVAENINVTGISNDGSGNYSVAFTAPNGKEQTLTVAEDIQVTGISNDGSGNYSVTLTTSSGATQTLTVTGDVKIGGAKFDEATGVWSYSLVNTSTGATTDVNVGGGVNINNAIYDATTGQWSFTFDGPTVDNASQITVGGSVSIAGAHDDGNGNWSFDFVGIDSATGDKSNFTFAATGTTTISGADYVGGVWKLHTAEGDIDFTPEIGGTGWAQDDETGAWTYTNPVTGKVQLTAEITNEEIIPDKTMEVLVSYKIEDLSATQAQQRLAIMENIKNGINSELWASLKNTSGWDAFWGSGDSDFKKHLEEYNYDVVSYLRKFGDDGKVEVRNSINNIAQSLEASINGRSWAELLEDETFMMGYNLLAGLINGYETSYGIAGTTWIDPSCTGILNAIAGGLEEHSPSKATYEMGVNLIKGLQNGFDDTDFSADTIKDKVLNAIQEQMKELNAEDPISGLFQLANDQGLEHVSQLQNGDGYQYNGQKYADQFDAYDAFFNANGLDLQVNAETGFYDLFTAAGELINSYETIGEAIEEGVSEIDALFVTSNEIKKWIIDPMAQGMSTLRGKALKDAVEDGFSKYAAQNNITDSFDEWIDLASAEEVMDFYNTYVQESFNTSSQELQNSIDTSWAQIKDNALTTITTIVTDNQEAANEIYTIWTNTFSAIAKARTALLSGKTIAEGLSDDELRSYVNAYFQQDPNRSMTDALSEIYNYNNNIFENDVQPDLTVGSRPLTGTDQDLLFDSETGQYIHYENAQAFSTARDNAYREQLSEAYREMVGEDQTYLQSDQAINLLSLGLMNESGASEEELFGLFSQLYPNVSELQRNGVIELGNSYLDIAQRQAVAVDDSYFMDQGMGGTAAWNRMNSIERELEDQPFYTEGNQIYYKNSDGTIMVVSTSNAQDLETQVIDKEVLQHSYDNLTPEELDQRYGEIRADEVAGIVGRNKDGLEVYETNAKQAEERYTTATPAITAAIDMLEERGSLASLDINNREILEQLFPGIDLESLTVDDLEAKELELASASDQAATSVLAFKSALDQGLVYSGQTDGVDTFQDLETGETTTIPDIEVDEPVTTSTDTSTLNKENREAKSYGFTDKADWDAAAENIQNLATTSDELADSLTTDQEAAREVAKEISRYNKAVDAIASSYDDWKDAFVNDDLEAQRKNIKNIDKAYSDMLDLDYDTLPDSFLRSTENLELMKQAANGSQEAYDNLQSAAASALRNAIEGGDSMSEYIAGEMEAIADIDSVDVGAKIIVGESDIADRLAVMYGDAYNAAIAGGASVAEAMAIANQIINSVGYDAPAIEMEERTITLTGDIPDGWTPQPDGSVTTTDADGNTTVVKGVKATKVEGGSYTYTQTMLVPKKGSSFTKTAERVGGKSSGGSGGGGGGGGGGGKAKKLDKKKSEDEIERYHEITKVLDRLTDRLDTIDKLKNRAYGSGYLKNLQKEIDLTKKQCEAYQQYIDEAKEYLATDAARVASIGATFDEYGNISNYTEVMQGLIDQYNAFINKYNNATSKQQENMEDEKKEWDEWYEDRVEWIEKYEESLATANEQENALLEAQNKISELALEGIEYKVTIKTDLSKAEVDFLEYLIDKYDEVIEKQGETMSMLVAETDAALSNLSTLAQEQRELTDAYNEGTLNQADYTEGLQNLNDKILEELQNLEDLKDSITELYGNTLSTAADELDRHTAKIDAASEAMASYIQILGLLGNGTNYKQLTSFYDQQYQYSVQSLQTQQEYLAVLKQEEQYYLDRLAQNGELTDLEREQYEALEETINETQGNILSATQNTLTLITEAFNNEIESIFKDLEEKIAGVGNSLDGLADSYAYYQESQERYVNSAKELYEVSKLNRQIETSINDTTSIVNKNLLKQLQDKINKQSELNELTQYDIDMNNLQYQLLLKKIALEDAQNAKSVVQLTRDTEGNYMYRYTANQDEVAKSQQEYEDILQQINDLSVNRAADLESQLLSIYQTTTSKIKEIAMDQTLTEDEKYAKIQELMTRFTEQSTYIQQEYQKVTGNLMENQLAISDYYGTELQTSAGETSLGLNSTIADMIAHTADLQYQMQLTCADAIPAAMQEMADRIDAVSQTIGINFDNINASIGTYNKIVLDAQTESSKLATTLEEQVLPEIHDITDAWDKYNDQLQEVVDTYEKMYSAIVAILKAQASLGGASGAATSSPSGNSYATGGLVDYTGPAWVDGTKNKPELMLNATDTANLLQTVSSLNELDSNTIGVINQYILNAVSAMSSAYSGLTASQVPLTNNELSQNVHITAEFPNATNHQEIEDAFDNLVNRAAQYVTTIKD